MRFERSDSVAKHNLHATALSMNKLPFFTPQALYRLKKIVQWNPNRPLARRANAMLLLGERQIQNRNCRVIAGREVERKPLDKLVSNG